ncbi:Translation release factor pelota-like protein [Corchorus olitorius]|uniref:Translation release factor pelota-like protein n=1 Tax=Corchorus olitorius TaxID=93759 RepID=A0A1R3K2W0_9ROSI|nr:Translation release factor pelota-like protein [Corchorus olitorius]
MKILSHRKPVADGPGTVKLIPVESDDLWVVYNLIAVGDKIRAPTVRKILINKPDKESCDSVEAALLKQKKNKSDRVALVLEIKVEKIDYDKQVSVLHASKALGSSAADVAVILMQKGLANLLLVGNNMTTTRSKIETPIPRKHGNEIIGTKKRDMKSIIENKSRIILAHSSSGFKHSLKDLLDDPSVKNMIKDTKAAMEVRALKDFFAMLSKDSNRVCYGTKHIEIAHERLAIQTLLITDELFRNSDVLTRQKYIKLVDSVKDAGGIVHIFSSMHVSGEQLAQLTGIAAILRFPLPELEDIEM